MIYLTKLIKIYTLLFPCQTSFNTLSFSQLALQHYIPNLLLSALFAQILPFSLIPIFVAIHITDNPHATIYTAFQEYNNG